MASTDLGAVVRSIADAIRVENISYRTGGLQVLDDISLALPVGSISAIVGPNGAGKTTLFDVISGWRRPNRGRVLIGGEDVSTEAPYRRAARGVGRLFQEVRIFRRLTLVENVTVAFPCQKGESALTALCDPRWKAQRAAAQAAALELLEGFGLGSEAHRLASRLSFGQQKLLSLAALLATDARILLLDEPTAGLAPETMDRVLKIVQRLAREEHRTVLLIEHDLETVLQVSDIVFWLEAGRVVDQGAAEGVVVRNRERAATSQYSTSTPLGDSAC